MTNFGALAILAALPEHAPLRHMRLLIAVETFSADEKGWRSASNELVCRRAKLGRTTFKIARRELMDDGWIDHKPGQGRGNYTKWRLLIDIPDGDDDEKGSDSPAPNSRSTEKGSDTPAPYLSVKGSDPAAKRGRMPPRKGSPKNAPACGNANTALEPSALGSSLSRKLAELVHAAAPAADEREIERFVAHIQDDPEVKHPAAWLKTVIANDDLQALIADVASPKARTGTARAPSGRRPAEADTPTPIPPSYVAPPPGVDPTPEFIAAKAEALKRAEAAAAKTRSATRRSRLSDDLTRPARCPGALRGRRERRQQEALHHVRRDEAARRVPPRLPLPRRPPGCMQDLHPRAATHPAGAEP